MRRLSLRHAVVAIAALGVAMLLASRYHRVPGAAPLADVELAQLPYFAFRSVLRLVVAYVGSFVFALSYGYAAASSKRAEKILLPILDILQSVPVVGFFPVAVAFFVAIAPGLAGVELASTFLIFTGMAWNMAFGVFEGLTTIPSDAVDAIDSFGVRGSQRATKLLFPSVIPRLVPNSIISWAGGWYFLISCEIFSAGADRHTLPGLGSFLQRTMDEGRLRDNLLGVLTLVAVVVAFDLLLWRPLSTYAERFKYELTASSARDENAVLEWWLRAKAPRAVRRALARPMRALARGGLKAWTGTLGRSAATRSWTGRAFALAGLALVAILVVELVRALVNVASSPWPAEARRVPLAVLASFGRLLVAYVIALAWTIPVAIWAGQRPRAAHLLTPIAEIGASVPAVALFPIMVVVLIGWIGVNGAAIALVLTGMQWYLLFNLLSGVTSIPEDLKEATRSLGMSRRQRWARLVLPAIAPAAVTGSITGWGGGWNALIVSEQIKYGGQTYNAFGIGQLLDDATNKPDNVLLGLSLVAMIAAVVVLNRLVWRRLYAWAAERFKIEY